MTTAQQHYVQFYSPGTLAAETTARPIDSWDVNVAVKMAMNVQERHMATPYGFRFTTRGRGPKDLDSREIARSPFYWLGGDVETIEQVRERADPSERILLSNMECNGWNKIITNKNSYRWTQPLGDDDIVLEFAP